MMNIIKQVVASIVALLMAYTVVTGLSSTPSDVALYMLIGAGLLLLLVGLITNIHRMSRVSLGVISRAEVYGIFTVLVGWMSIVNNRIDSLYQILIGMK